MHIMRQIFCNLQLFLALGLCFRSSGAEEFTATDANITPNTDTLKHITGIIGTATRDAVTELQTEPTSYHLQTTPVNTMGTVTVDPTTVNTTPLNPTIEQTTPESAPDSETTATAQIEQTTMIMTTLPVYKETTVIELKTPEAPTTSQYETTVGLSEPNLTSLSERPTDLITTAALVITTVSTEAPSPTNIMTEAPSPTNIMTEAPSPTNIMTEAPNNEITPIVFNSVHTRTTTSTETLTFVSTNFTSNTSIVLVGQVINPAGTNWLLICVVCGVIAGVLCIIVIVFVQQRKKSASRTFEPAYMNGQSKRSKKKKGAEDDAWAGPVNLEAGDEFDGDVQEGLLPNNGKQDGDEVMLSTFATLDEDGMSNGGVGKEGTKEAKKWEEQEPMLFIDEDVDENKTGKTLAGNERLEGDGKSEGDMNGGEAFCLTTAV